MKKQTVRALALIVFFLNGASAQTLQEAQDQAAIEKSKAEAAASRAQAKKSDLELQNAEEVARLEVQEAQDKADEAKRKALTESITAVNALKTTEKDVHIDGNPIETKALAHRAVTKVADKIAVTMPTEVCTKSTTVILADDMALGALPAYEVSVQSLKSLQKSYSDFLDDAEASFVKLKGTHDKKEKSPILGLTALLQGVAAVGAIAQTFKTQISVKSSDVTIEQIAINGALAGAWRAKCPSSTLTAFPNLGIGFATSDAAKLMEALEFQLSRGQALESNITLWLIPNKVASAIDLEGIDAARKAAAASPKKPAPTTQQVTAAEVRKATIAEIELVLAKLKAADQRVDQSIQQLVTTSEKQPVSPIVQLAKGERFASAVKSPGAYVLTIKAVGGGGNTVTTNNFWRGPKVFHSGGAVIAYTLLKATNGAYIAGGVLDSHQGYIQLDIAEKTTLGSSWDVEAKAVGN